MEIMIVMTMISREALNGNQLTYPEIGAEPVVCRRKSSVFSINTLKIYSHQATNDWLNAPSGDPARSIMFVFHDGKSRFGLNTSTVPTAPEVLY
jgi:hypothetical protein